MGIRAFVACSCDGQTSTELTLLAEELRARVEGAVRLPPPQSHHATIAFFPALSADELAAISTSLEDCRGRGAIEYVLTEPKLLYRARGSSVVYCDVQESAGVLTSLQETVRRALAQSNAESSVRYPRQAHVTVARTKRVSRETLRSALRQVGRSGKESGEIRKFDRLELIRSTLTPTGPQYESELSIDL